VTEGDARVTYREDDDKWAVEVEGAAWAGSRHDRKAHAEQVARAAAEENEAELHVHGKDGQVKKRATYKRGATQHD
jgi:hypothetical protein